MNILEMKATKENPNGFSDSHLEVEYLSASRIKQLAESGWHYKRTYLDKVWPEDTPAKKFGRIVHTALLEPAKFKESFHILPEFKGTGSRKAKADHIDSLPEGTLIITEDEETKITNMINNLMTHGRAKKLMSKGVTEQRVYAYDPEFDVVWHGVVDFYRQGNILVEVKTCQSAKLNDFKKQYAQLGYHRQAWIYRRLFKLLTGSLPPLYTIAIENKEPHSVAVFNHPAGLYEQAEHEIRQAVHTYKKCKESGDWGFYYNDGVISLDLPSYYLYNSNEELELSE